MLSEALELETERQRQFLDHSCADDADLRAEVDLLLAHQVDTNVDAMEACVADAARLRVDAFAAATTGSRIGVYKVLRELGHGGEYRRSIAL